MLNSFNLTLKIIDLNYFKFYLMNSKCCLSFIYFDFFGFRTTFKIRAFVYLGRPAN